MGDIVRGEASESDNEPTESEPPKPSLVSVVRGEDNESDDSELDTSRATNMSDRFQETNVLQRLLIGNNMQIWTDLLHFSRNLLAPNFAQLQNTDQLMVKSQVTFLMVLTTLKAAQHNTRRLHEEMCSIFSTNFLPAFKKA